MSVILIILLVVICIVIFIALELRRKIREFSQAVFGNANMLEGIREQKIQLANEPKSVAGMEKLLLPTLAKDFPNLNISEMKKMAENSILLCLKSIENKRIENFEHTSERITNWINSKIDDFKANETIN